MAADTLTVRDTLRATVVGLADPDALPWLHLDLVRLDGATETAIAGATDASYELMPTDAGKHVRAKARFEDLLGNGETLASRRIGPVMWPAGTPAWLADGSVELIWTAEVGVAGTTGDGYSSTSAMRQPVGPRLPVRDDRLHGHRPVARRRRTSPRQDLLQASAAGLVLHVCDEASNWRAAGAAGAGWRPTTVRLLAQFLVGARPTHPGSG